MVQRPARLGHVFFDDHMNVDAAETEGAHPGTPGQDTALAVSLRQPFTGVLDDIKRTILELDVGVPGLAMQTLNQGIVS